MSEFLRFLLDGDRNPLRALPPAQRFQTMAYLALMWTSIFCAGTGAWLWYGELLTAHILVALGFLITTYVFSRTQKRTAPAHCDPRSADGASRRDGIWGTP
jgi:Flp pilus assembly protein TadB